MNTPADRELFEMFMEDTRVEREWLSGKYEEFLKEQRENDTQNKILKDIKENEDESIK